ncbi:MAG: hypothetical protein M1296_00475 [Chloroflexi bacterium]|nr:hypothetical protein [Chloroflexota bacterium]
MKHLLIFLFATLLTGGFVGKVRAEATEPAIVITVTDQGGAPLPFATITVTEAHGMLTSHLQANAQGMLTLTGPFNTNVAPYVICASVADSHNTYSSCTYNVMPPAPS